MKILVVFHVVVHKLNNCSPLENESDLNGTCHREPNDINGLYDVGRNIRNLMGDRVNGAGHDEGLVDEAKATKDFPAPQRPFCLCVPENQFPGRVVPFEGSTTEKIGGVHVETKVTEDFGTDQQHHEKREVNGREICLSFKIRTLYSKTIQEIEA